MSYTQVPANGSGNKIDTVTHTSGSDLLHRQVVVLGNEDGDVMRLTTGKGALVGTSREKFRDEFRDLTNWTIIQDGGMGYGVAGETGGSRYFYVDAGTTNGAEFIMQSTALKLGTPVKVVFGVTASQAITGNEFHVELVEVDDDGNIVTDTGVTTSAAFNDARNGVGVVFDGTSQNNARYKIRAQGCSELVPAAQTFGTNSRVAGGTTPNFTAPYQTEITLLTDMVAVNSRTVNSTGAGTNVITRTDYVPNPDRHYTIRVRCKNASAPASGTTFRIHFMRVIDASRVSVDFGIVGGIQSDSLAGPVKIVSSVNLAAAGTVAEDGSLSSTNPVPMGVRARNANPAAMSATGDAIHALATMIGAQVVRPFSIPELQWSYPAASGGIANTTTAVTVKTAAGSGIRNYVTSLDLSWDSLTNATEFAIRDGAAGTVLFRRKIPSGAAGHANIQFADPLKGTANTLLEIVTLTASGAGGVFANLTGHAAP